jgi:adenylate cyclase
MKFFSPKKPIQARRGLLVWLLGLIFALLSLTPQANLLEEKIGLGLLFYLRGSITPPKEVVIVSIDRGSALRLAAPHNPEQWPRRLYATLIRRLHEAGAELIAFDIFFGAAQPGDDEEMGAAMRAGQFAVLADYLKQEPIQGDAYLESLETPTPALASAALAHGPFLLPPGEEADRFLTRYGDGNERPTLPLLLLLLHLLKTAANELAYVTGYPIPQGIDGDGGEEIERYLSSLTRALRQNEDSASLMRQRLLDPAIPASKRAALRALLTTLSPAGESRYFNHYGPKDAFAHIPLHRLLDPDYDVVQALHGKIVVVGFDANFQADRSETLFLSPFSPVGPLELIAAALSNLLENRETRPLFGRWEGFFWVLAYGATVGWIGRSRLLFALPGVLSLSMAYFAAACWLFGAHGLWAPIVLPVGLLTPAGMAVAVAAGYMARSRENRKIQSVISRIVPVEAASRLIHPDREGIWESRLNFGVCLASDAGQYTALAENMEPMKLGELMNDYYSALFPCVNRNGGWVSDVIGDAMMAIWTSPGDSAELRRQALRAALEVRRAAHVFEASRQIVLPIRIGMHCGEMRVGFLGDSKHGAYRAMGDTVNTAARLEALNKPLGVKLLVSDLLIAGMDDFVSRPLGEFLLAGKSWPIKVHELIAPVGAAPTETLDMIERFRLAMEIFQTGEWQEAAAAFEELANVYPEDGPIRFYAETARQRALRSPETAFSSAIAAVKPSPAQLSPRE